MIYLATICHDLKSNTLEATWLEEVETELKRVKCRNYSAEQKDEFLADCGANGQKYADLAEW
jgi:ribonuclease D